jgi:hypothetical protein
MGLGKAMRLPSSETILPAGEIRRHNVVDLLLLCGGKPAKFNAGRIVAHVAAVI